MNPSPCVRLGWKIPNWSTRAAPARPAMELPMSIATNLVRSTDTPRLSAAWGLSPTERMLRPNVVRVNNSAVTGTSRNAR